MGRGSARKKFALRRNTQLGDGNQPKVRSYEPIIPELRCADRKLWLTGERGLNKKLRHFCGGHGGEARVVRKARVPSETRKMRTRSIAAECAPTRRDGESYQLFPGLELQLGLDIRAMGLHHALRTTIAKWGVFSSTLSATSGPVSAGMPMSRRRLSISSVSASLAASKPLPVSPTACKSGSFARRVQDRPERARDRPRSIDPYRRRPALVRQNH